MRIYRNIFFIVVVSLALSGCSSYKSPSPYQRPFLGAAQALVTIIEYSDFQCPACKAAVPIVDEVIKQSGQQVHFEFHHFPLPMHELAFKAAVAAECAADQGKFWEYHNRLFNEQPNLQRQDLIKYAGDLGLNVDTFTQCLGASDPEKRVRDDLNAAMKLNLPGTPSFFLNGAAVDDWTKLPQLVEATLINLKAVSSTKP